MATLKRRHAPVPWGAQVDMTPWKKSRSGRPRRPRSDRPPLALDPGWDWDGRRLFLSETRPVVDLEERECEICGSQTWEDEHAPGSSGRTRATLSLLDVARCRVAKKRSQGASVLGDFEVIRVPKVVPVSEEGSYLGDDYALGEWESWERLDALGLRRTYAEAARGFVDGTSHAPGCSRVAEDDVWECL